MKILAFDPSGSYFEGKGTTGWALFYNGTLTSVGQLRAIQYNSRFHYWKSHIDLIKAIEPDIIILEDFVLYASKQKSLVGSELETAQLLGVLKYYLDEEHISWHTQQALIKSRYNNKILLHKEIITKSGTRLYAVGVPVSGHILDAIRHGVYFIQFTLPKLKEREKHD